VLSHLPRLILTDVSPLILRVVLLLIGFTGVLILGFLFLLSAVSFVIVLFP
jgi:hypothetical protein